MGQQGGNLSDENVAAVRKAFQDHVSTGFISIDTVVGTGYVPMQIIKLPESTVSGHETYLIVISILTVEGSSQAQHEMSGYADNIVAIFVMLLLSCMKLLLEQWHLKSMVTVISI